MSDREPIIAAAAIFILLLVWIGGMIEPSHDFAGSALGGAFAVTGTLLLLMPLSLAAIKRIDIVKKAVVGHISMKTMLIWHIYAGFLGTILILLHTGHKFGGVLATSLTAFTICVLFSGVIGRYLQRHIGDDVRDKRQLLNQLYENYDFVTDHSSPSAIGTISLVNIVNLVSSIADVESAITSRDTLKQWFTIWFRAHVALIIGMYLLLILHIWSGIHFGLRWFQ